MGKILPEYTFNINEGISSGSTDMGDLSCIMPVVHPYAGGAKGTAHGSDYYIEDPEAACVASAKMQMAMLYILLSDGAKRAKAIIENYKPLFASKEDYFAYVDSLNKTGDRIAYGESGEARVNTL